VGRDGRGDRTMAGMLKEGEMNRGGKCARGTKGWGSGATGNGTCVWMSTGEDGARCPRGGHNGGRTWGHGVPHVGMMQGTDRVIDARGRDGREGTGGDELGGDVR